MGEGRSAAHLLAVMFSRPEMVKMLLERGADPNHRAEDIIIGNAVTAAFFAMNGTQLIGMGGRPTRRAPRHGARSVEARRSTPKART